MMLTWNILLAFIWLACWGEMTAGQFIVGFVLGFILLRVSERVGLLEESHYSSRLLGFLELSAYFLKELWNCNIRMARDVLRPQPQMTPAIIEVPIDLKSEWAITVMANLITLTPGTLSLDMSPGNKSIFIHTMYYDNEDREAFVASIKNGFERRLRILEGSAL
jgi:multicomponent Na+:H+ antiporter subunit E